MEWLNRLGLVTASVVVALLVGELAVRLTLGHVEPPNAGRVEPPLAGGPEIPGVRYTMKPNAEGRQRFSSDPRGYFDPDGSLTYRTNSFGFRGPETTEPKPPGVFRIIGLGDSFAFGRGVRTEDTFLARLQRLLDEEAGPRAFEVLNWGVAGYDTTDEVNLLKHRGPAFSPDLVVICFFLNDAKPAALEPGRAPWRRDRAGGSDVPWWRRSSALLDQLAARWERLELARRRVAGFLRAYQDDAPGWLETQAGLRQAAEEAKTEGFKLVLMIFPVLWDLSGPSPFLEIHRKVAAFGESLDLPVLDLLPAFAGHDGPELWAHPSDQHPNAEAHAIAAHALFEFLLERDLVEPTNPASGVPRT